MMMIRYMHTTLILFILSVVIARDRTTERRASGTDVVLASISKLQDTCIFANDFQFLRRIAWHETQDGIKGRNAVDLNSGIWGTDDYILQTVQNSQDDDLAIALGQLDAQFNITIYQYNWSSGDLEVPMNSVAVSRAKLLLANKTALPMTLKEQADFWATKYHKGARDANDFLKSMGDIPKCNLRGMDLMFIIDASGSIGGHAFDKARNFIETVVNGFDISIRKTRVGVIEYSSDTKVIITFSGDKAAIIKAVQDMPYMNDMTATGDALRMATEEFNHHGRDPAKGFPFVAVLLTDGQPDWSNGHDADPQDALDAAEELKKAGITLFTIGIANADMSNLQTTASNPKCQHFYVLKDYSTLAAQFPEILTSQTCTASAYVPGTVQQVNATVEQGQAAYFRLAANVSDGVTLKVSTEEGDTTIYASLTNRAPSEGDYDFKADAPKGMLGQIFITPDDLEKALDSSKTMIAVYILSDVPEEEKGQTVTVFSAVYGNAPNNSFVMHINDGDTVVTMTPAPATLPKPTTPLDGCRSF
ncbi:Fibropellin-3 [Aphelenchoides avenae]|nr:Fibropellin-3 [Aphelenchus avenae]